MAYYTHVNGLPQNQTKAQASQVRAELDAIATSWTTLPSQSVLWGAGFNYAADTGAANAYVATVASTYIVAYTDGMSVKVKATAANTGASTLNLNSLGIKSIVRSDGSALVAGDIAAGQIVVLTYNVTTDKFHLAGTGQTGATGPAESIGFIDKGTVAAGTVTFTLGTRDKNQRVQASGNITLAISGWAASGTLDEVLLECVNFGGRTITFPTGNWVKFDGSFAATAALGGVTFQTAGTDFVLAWTRDGGTTVYFKAMR